MSFERFRNHLSKGMSVHFDRWSLSKLSLAEWSKGSVNHLLARC